MEQWCNVLLVLLSQLALWVNNAWSWILENAGERLPAWWARQPRAVKIAVLSGVTIVLGGGAWALGQYLFSCAQWPPLVTAAFMIVSAIAGLFIGGKRWEAGKRRDAEAEAQRLAAENRQLVEEVHALEFQLSQLRRPSA